MSKRRRKKKAEQAARAIPRGTPGLVVRDPIAELIDRLDRVQQEYDQINREIRAALARAQDGHVDAMEHAGEMIDKARRGMSAEELEKVRQIAGREQAREIGELRVEIEKEAKALLTGPKMTFTPQVDDLVVIGGAKFEFHALVQGKYPKMAIDEYLEKRRGLAALQRTKTMLGAAGPGYAQELVPICVADFTGAPRRPLAEHRALLAARGIEQTL